jgi:transcriptional regulator with XRE-family HTH domain
MVEARLRAALSRPAVAELLQVSQRTVLNWEKSRARPPYSAFRVLQIAGGWELPAWSGWRIAKGALWSPEGHSFREQDFSWWSLTCGMARAFMARHGQEAGATSVVLKLTREDLAISPLADAPYVAEIDIGGGASAPVQAADGRTAGAREARAARTARPVRHAP